MSRVEIAVALASVVSVVFAGYQTLLLRQSISTPFEANLQNRQVDVCAQLIRESQQLISFYEARIAFPKEYSDLIEKLGMLSGNKGNAYPYGRDGVIDDENWSKGEVFFLSSSIDPATGVRGALAEMRPYSTDQTAAQIDTALGSIFATSFALFDTSSETIETRLKDVRGSLEPFRKRCIEVMLGREKGMF